MTISPATGLAVSLAFSSIITGAIWIVRNVMRFDGPSFLFNLMGYLQLPGQFLMLIFVMIINPSGAWEAMHASGPFHVIGYLFNFTFYFFVAYGAISIARKRAPGSQDKP